MKAIMASQARVPELEADDLGDRAAPVAHRGHEAREVVDGADEHDAQADPEQAGQPAELLAGQDRARRSGPAAAIALKCWPRR